MKKYVNVDIWVTRKTETSIFSHDTFPSSSISVVFVFDSFWKIILQLVSNYIISGNQKLFYRNTI